MIYVKTDELLEANFDYYHDFIRPAMARYCVLKLDKEMGCKHMWDEQTRKEYKALKKLNKHLNGVWGEE